MYCNTFVLGILEHYDSLSGSDMGL